MKPTGKISPDLKARIAGGLYLLEFPTGGVGLFAIPGLIGEGSLTVWLVVAGVNAERWREQASAAAA